MTLLQHHILALSVTATTTFGLGLFVFLAQPKKRLNQIFGLYSLSIAWWATAEAAMNGAPDAATACFWSPIEWAGVIFIAPTFLHTVHLLTRDKKPGGHLLLRLVYLSSFVVLFLHLFFNCIALPPAPSAYSHYSNRLTPLGLVLPVLFLTVVNLGLWRLYASYRVSTGQRRRQLQLLFYGSMIGYAGGSFDWLLTFGLCIPPLNPFGIYAVPLYSLATTYAIFQHRLFDVNVVIRKSLVYSILVTLLTIGYFGLVYGIEQFFKTTLGYQSARVSLLAFAVMALAFQPLKIGIQRLVDWLIFRQPQEQIARKMERLERESLQTEKLRAISTLAAGLCHELRNPLQAIQTHAEFLPERYDDAGFRKSCSDVMQTEISRINGLLRQLMEFAKPKPPTFRPVSPLQVLDSTLDMLNSEFLRRRVTLEKRYEANGTHIQADADQLRQVILNLVMNALQAVPENGCVTVATREERGWYTLEVSDSGPGIDPRILPKLFEPFNSTKPNGTGLGLSIVHTIVQEHRGRIQARNLPGFGASFTLQLPLD